MIGTVFEVEARPEEDEEDEEDEKRHFLLLLINQKSAVF